LKVSELNPEDLRRLRQIVKRVHLRHNPIEFITDYEADRVIESIGGQTAERMLRRMIDAKMLN